MFVSCAQKRRHYFAALRLCEINQSRAKAQSSQLNLRINSIGDVPSPDLKLILLLVEDERRIRWTAATFGMNYRRQDFAVARQ